LVKKGEVVERGKKVWVIEHIKQLGAELYIEVFRDARYVIVLED